MADTDTNAQPVICARCGYHNFPAQADTPPRVAGASGMAGTGPATFRAETLNAAPPETAAVTQTVPPGTVVVEGAEVPENADHTGV